MSEHLFNAFVEPVAALHHNGKRVLGLVDNVLANAVVTDYSACRRNNLCFFLNTPSVQSITARQRNIQQRICPDIPIAGRVRGNTLRIHVRCSGSVENKLHIVAELIGFPVSVSGEAPFDIADIGASEAWHTLDLDITGVDTSAVNAPLQAQAWLRLSVYSTDYAATTFTLYGVSGYCLGDSSPPVYTDLTATNSKAGTDDYADSALLRRLIRDNAVAVHEARVPGNNIVNHWLRQWYSAGNYGVNNDQLGRYKVIKRKGVTSVSLFVLYETGAAGPTFTLKATLGGVVKTAAALASAGTTAWVTLQWTGLTNDEYECELLIDASEPTAANAFYAPFVMLIEDFDAAIAHTVPFVEKAQTGKVVLATEYNNARDTLDSQYNCNTGIMMCDWRCSIFGYSFDNRFQADATAMVKDDFGPNVAAGFGGSIVARTILFPSPSSKRLRVTMAYKVFNDLTALKAINIQLSHSMVATTWDDVDPAVDQTAGTLIVGGQGAYDGSEVLYYTCELDIPAATWQLPTAPNGADVPYQVWISMCTTDAAEYLMPLMVCITELPLGTSEFP